MEPTLRARTPAAPFLKLPSPLQPWSRHSRPLPPPLIFECCRRKVRISVCPQPYPKAAALSARNALRRGALCGATRAASSPSRAGSRELPRDSASCRSILFSPIAVPSSRRHFTWGHFYCGFKGTLLMWFNSVCTSPVDGYTCFRPERLTLANLRRI